MKALLSFLLMASVSVCSAAEIKKTIQVSATIAPYCVIGFEQGNMKYVCRGYRVKKTMSLVMWSSKRAMSLSFTTDLNYE